MTQFKLCTHFLADARAIANVSLDGGSTAEQLQGCTVHTYTTAVHVVVHRDIIVYIQITVRTGHTHSTEPLPRPLHTYTLQFTKCLAKCVLGILRNGSSQWSPTYHDTRKKNL